MEELYIQKILQYPWLSSEEQATLAQQIQAQPEWWPLLEALQALAPILRPLHPRFDEAVSEELLAYYLVTRCFSEKLVSPEIRAYFKALEVELETNTALQQRLQALALRLQELMKDFDASQHFAVLTGRSFEAVGGGEAPKVNDTKGGSEESIEVKGSLRPARAWSRQGRRWRWVERGALVVVLLAAVYSALAVWSRHQQSDLERLGFISPALLETDTYRGERAETSGPEAVYEQAVAQLRQAYVSVLGLFPHYRRAPLREAAVLLEQVVVRPDASPLLRHQAAFLLGKVRLLLEDVPSAQQAFGQALELDGPYAMEARRVLEALAELEP